MKYCAVYLIQQRRLVLLSFYLSTSARDIRECYIIKIHNTMELESRLAFVISQSLVRDKNISFNRREIRGDILLIFVLCARAK